MNRKCPKVPRPGRLFCDKEDKKKENSYGAAETEVSSLNARKQKLSSSKSFNWCGIGSRKKGRIGFLSKTRRSLQEGGEPSRRFTLCTASE